ncbi:MAG: extracellular solute-binding protein [Eubacteriales bacterium]
MKRLSMSLAVLFLLSILFTSCSGSPADTVATQLYTTAAVTAQSTQAKLVPVLPERDFGGAQIGFLVREYDPNGYWGSQEIFSAEENGEPINDAVYRRNRYVEDQYNVKIAETRTNDVFGNAKKAILSGDTAYDMVLTDFSSAASLASQGLLQDLSSLPYLDLGRPWYDQRANEQMSIYGKLFMTVGELNILDNDATWVVMFNKKVAKDNGIENLYQLVYDEEWTLDKFNEVIHKVSKDINGDSVYDENDQMGLLTDDGFMTMVFYNMGIYCAQKDKDDVPYLSLNDTRTPEILSKIYEIINDKTATINANKLTHIKNPWTDGVNKMFQENRGLFYCISLTVMHKLRNMESDFGVLPYPKYDGQSEYHHTVQPSTATCFIVPISTADTERTAIILEALSAESMYTLTPAYYDITITNKLIRDEDSAYMLDIIFSTRQYDLGFIFNWGNIGYLSASLKYDASTFVSKYEANEEKYKAQMEKTLEEFRNIA